MIVLRVVGSLYLLSGVWCLARPGLASGFLAIQFASPAGLAEFISVYGGLQIGLGLAMWWVPKESMQMLAALRYTTVVSSALFSARLWSMISVSVTPALLAMAVLEGVLVALLLMALQKHRARQALL